METPATEPSKQLSVTDTVALIVGIVVGVGIFKTPSLVATFSGDSAAFFVMWLAGGAASLVGALCYAELAGTYPHRGGDYHYLGLAFGKRVAFLYAWARMTVIQTGSIAMLAFILGDYLAQALPLGPYSSSLYGGLSVVFLTWLNICGIRQGKWAQNVLSAVKVLGLSLIVAAALALPSQPAAAGPTASPSSSAAGVGMAMIFVLLTYGGWNEAAFVSAELRNVRKNMLRALCWSIVIITLIYLLVNYAFVRALGFESLARSDAVASDAMRKVLGAPGSAFVDLLVCISALGAINATIITGARTNFALGEQFTLFRGLGRWHEASGTPRTALWVQGAIALLLVLLGAVTRNGFVTVVEYTAPVFWLFFLLATLSLIVLRRRDPAADRPFRVPLYPLTPILFAAVCVFMLKASIQYTGVGALIGLAVLLSGIPILAWSTSLESRRR